MRRLHYLLIIVVTCVTVSGCRSQSHNPSYSTTPSRSNSDQASASELNQRGLEYVSNGDRASAAEAFRAALWRDIRFAPAHNNLGLVLLEDGRVYESASEFAFAAKLNPGSPEPIVNLGRLYESVGWRDAAIKEYKKALTIVPSFAAARAGIARLEKEGLPKHETPLDVLE